MSFLRLLDLVQFGGCCGWGGSRGSGRPYGFGGSDNPKVSVLPPSSMVLFNLQLLLGTSLQICIFEGINKSTISPQLICPTFLNARLPSLAFQTFIFKLGFSSFFFNSPFFMLHIYC